MKNPQNAGIPVNTVFSDTHKANLYETSHLFNPRKNICAHLHLDFFEPVINETTIHRSKHKNVISGYFRREAPKKSNWPPLGPKKGAFFRTAQQSTRKNHQKFRKMAAQITQNLASAVPKLQPSNPLWNHDFCSAKMRWTNYRPSRVVKVLPSKVTLKHAYIKIYACCEAINWPKFSCLMVINWSKVIFDLYL